MTEIDDAPQKLKDIPERGRFAFAQGLPKFLHHLGRDFRDAPFAEQWFEMLEVTVAIRGQPFEGRPLDVKIGVRDFGKGLVLFSLFFLTSSPCLMAFIRSARISAATSGP